MVEWGRALAERAYRWGGLFVTVALDVTGREYRKIAGSAAPLLCYEPPLPKHNTNKQNDVTRPITQTRPPHLTPLHKQPNDSATKELLHSVFISSFLCTSEPCRPSSHHGGKLGALCPPLLNLSPTPPTNPRIIGAGWVASTFAKDLALSRPEEDDVKHSIAAVCALDRARAQEAIDAFLPAGASAQQAGVRPAPVACEGVDELLAREVSPSLLVGERSGFEGKASISPLRVVVLGVCELSQPLSSM